MNRAKNLTKASNLGGFDDFGTNEGNGTDCTRHFTGVVIYFGDRGFNAVSLVRKTDVLLDFFGAVAERSRADVDLLRAAWERERKHNHTSK